MRRSLIRNGVARIYMSVGVTWLPFFRMTVTMRDSADVLVSCSIHLMDEEPHPFVHKLSYAAMSTGMRCMNSRFAVTVYPHRGSSVVMKDVP